MAKVKRTKLWQERLMRANAPPTITKEDRDRLNHFGNRKSDAEVDFYTMGIVKENGVWRQRRIY